MLYFESSPLWLFAIIPLCFAAAFAYYATEKKIPKGSKAWKTWLIASRGAALACVAMLLLGPYIKHQKSEIEKPVALILRDNSLSAAAGSGFSALEYSAQLAKITGAASSRFNVQEYRFAGYAEKESEADFTGASTDYTRLFSELNELHAADNIAAVIIATDGNHTAGEPMAYAARRLQTAAPFIIIGMGDTAKKNDIYIQDVKYNQNGYVNKISHIAATVGWHGIEERRAKIRLLSADSLVAEKTVTISGVSGAAAEAFNFIPQREGIYPLKIEIEQLPSDEVPNNNTYDLYIEAHSLKKQIKFLAPAPHPDAGAFYRALASNSNYETGHIKTAAEVFAGKTDMLVLTGPLPHKSFIDSLQNRSIPLLWLRGIAGVQPGPHAYGIEITRGGRAIDAAFPSINANFGLFNISNELQALARASMPISVPFADFRITDQQQHIIARQAIRGVETEKPLMLASLGPRYRSVSLLGQGYWHWRVQDYASENNFSTFDAFANTLSEFLLSGQGEKRLSIRYPRISGQGDMPVFVAQYIDLSGQLSNSASIGIAVTDSTGKRTDMVFAPRGADYSLVMPALEAGRYSFAAAAFSNADTVRESGVFYVSRSAAEMLNTSMNIEQLGILLDEREGGIFSLAQDIDIAEALSQIDSRPIARFSTRYADVMGYWWVFLAIALMLAAEWAARKYLGAP
jgi:hypothetical protein